MSRAGSMMGASPVTMEQPSNKVNHPDRQREKAPWDVRNGRHGLVFQYPLSYTTSVSMLWRETGDVLKAQAHILSLCVGRSMARALLPSAEGTGDPGGVSSTMVVPLCPTKVEKRV